MKNLELLLITLGSQQFGLPLEDIRCVSPLPAGFANCGTEAETHFVHEDSPLPYVSLWDRLGAKSAYAEFEELHSMLPLRRQDHLDWMAALESSLRSGVPFAKARDPRACAFGKWFYNFRGHDRRLALLLDQFETPHANIHLLADRLLELADGGRQAEALQAFEDARNGDLAVLLALFDSTQKLVLELQRRIAIVVANAGHSCALGADRVQDIVSIPADRVKRNGAHAARIAAGPMSALVVMEDQKVVPILDWQAFNASARSTYPENAELQRLAA